jgi:hypothetical protein
VSHLQELYGAEISPELISLGTEAVREEIVAWRSRPIVQAYAVVRPEPGEARVRGRTQRTQPAQGAATRSNQGEPA